ncbi:MAG: hypothetical protein ACK5PS_08845 [Desulfopila sp.]
MFLSPYARRMLELEAKGLLTRLARVRPLALTVPAVAAAHISARAAIAIEEYLLGGRRQLRQLVSHYLDWLRSSMGNRVETQEAQRRLAILRLKFNAVLTQLDIFADALVQRCEHVNGVWLAGLDLLAKDALDLPGDYFTAPPLVVYLDRGHGAAIRRARTRLPGGGKNPVAIIRIPRERMISSGIASSLVHEVGHQGAALLGLNTSLAEELSERRHNSSAAHRLAWDLWWRWLSEILADFWSLARVGVAATQGLIGVVSLPRPFVFRFSLDDPHPVPWLRVKLSCAMGQQMYPHYQWARLAALWEAFYPKTGLPGHKRRIIQTMEETMPQFISLLFNHQPVSLRGKTLYQAFRLAGHSPERLSALYDRWLLSPREMQLAPPTLVFAALGQARQAGKLFPAEEGRIVARLLNGWAVARAVGPHSSRDENRGAPFPT